MKNRFSNAKKSDREITLSLSLSTFGIKGPSFMELIS